MMKKRILSAILAVILVASAMSMAACGNKSVYEELAEEGFDVQIRFDACGGVVNDTQNVTIVEVLNSEDSVTINGKTGIKLLDPEDAARGKDGMFKVAKNDEKYRYFQAGWYTERTLRFDEAGNALDSFGEKVSVSGREQGYVYSGKWDFDNDVVAESDLTDGVFTLYAAWIPFFNYEMYSENESGDFELVKSVQKLNLTFPKWNDRKGEYDMKDFPKPEDDMVFVGAYYDEAMTQSVDTSKDATSIFVDYEKGIVESSTVKIYIKWEAAPTE